MSDAGYSIAFVYLLGAVLLALSAATLGPMTLNTMFDQWHRLAPQEDSNDLESAFVSCLFGPRSCLLALAELLTLAVLVLALWGIVTGAEYLMPWDKLTKLASVITIAGAMWGFFKVGRWVERRSIKRKNGS